LGRLTIHLVHTSRSTLAVDDRWDAALDEHAKLVESIRAQDEAGARKVAGVHMNTAQEIRLELLRDAAAQR
jgi:DNA-binding GntR family transcriptional regulator